VSGASNDDRPPMVVAMYWVQQVTSISIEMVAPAGLGYWLDKRWGTGPWVLAVGAVLGFLLALWHLLALAKRGGPGSSGPTQGRSRRK
jgi:F0F1-type ATP synthase assembly protein I